MPSSGRKAQVVGDTYDSGIAEVPEPLQVNERPTVI